MKLFILLFILPIILSSGCRDFSQSDISRYYDKYSQCDGANCDYLCDSLLHTLIQSPDNFILASVANSLSYQKWLRNIEDCGFVDYSNSNGQSLLLKKEMTIKAISSAKTSSIKTELLNKFKTINIRIID